MEFQSSEFRVSFLCQRFRKFMKINFMSEQVPDATTLLKFRHMIEENHLGEEFFKAINRVMEATGHIMHGGTIVDATIINAPSSTKNAEKKRDPEMHQTKKGNEWKFGMKCNIGVDSDLRSVSRRLCWAI